EEKKKDPLKLVQYIAENDIDIATLPPAYLKVIPVESIRPLKRMVSAGEAALLDKAISYSKSGTFYNGYGPTEAGICAAVFHLNREPSITIDSVPIGRPIANARIYIIDKYNSLVPVNVPGEICIGGHGLARGYLNQPSLTNDKF
ncbi:AMP-binding protein, partial [Niastella koreensis]